MPDDSTTTFVVFNFVGILTDLLKQVLTLSGFVSDQQISYTLQQEILDGFSEFTVYMMNKYAPGTNPAVAQVPVKVDYGSLYYEEITDVEGKGIVILNGTPPLASLNPYNKTTSGYIALLIHSQKCLLYLLMISDSPQRVSDLLCIQIEKSSQSSTACRGFQT